MSHRALWSCIPESRVASSQDSCPPSPLHERFAVGGDVQVLQRHGYVLQIRPRMLGPQQGLDAELAGDHVEGFAGSAPEVAPSEAIHEASCSGERTQRTSRGRRRCEHRAT
jgi:hypothetical protein